MPSLKDEIAQIIDPEAWDDRKRAGQSAQSVAFRNAHLRVVTSQVKAEKILFHISG